MLLSGIFEFRSNHILPVSRDEEDSWESSEVGKHVWNIIGGSINLAKDQVLVGAGHLLGQLGVDRVELFAVLALGREHEQDGVLLDLVLEIRKHFDKGTCIHRRLLRYKQLGGLEPVARLGVPLRYKASKLCYPIRNTFV